VGTAHSRLCPSHDLSSIQREAGRLAAEIGRRVEWLAIDRTVVVLAGERRPRLSYFRDSALAEVAQLAATTAPAANSKSPFVITSLIAPSGQARRGAISIWNAFYRPRLWRHKVNPATPDEIKACCDKKVA